MSAGTYPTGAGANNLRQVSNAAGARTAYVRAPAARPDPLQNAGFLLASAFVFLFQSRTFEILVPSLHIPSFAFWSAILVTILTGGVTRAFSHRVGVALLALTFWIALSVPFSVWIGDSLRVFNGWLRSVMAYAILTGLAAGWLQTRRLFHTMAYATFALSLLALKFGIAPEGRLLLSRGRLNNPNGLAHALLVGLPFCLYLVANPRLSRIHRATALLFMAPIVFAIARTGSRGALIAAIMVLILYWMRSTLAQKVRLLLSVASLFVIVVAFLPGTLGRRYTTLFEPKEFGDGDSEPADDSRLQDSAVTSSHGRMELLKDSIRLTLRHPILGVGPGQFAVAQDLLAKSEGRQKGMWHVTHNTLTEFSSEDGLPALCFFLAALILSFKAVWLPKLPHPRPPDWDEVENAAFYFSLSLCAWSVSMLFGNFAHQMEFPMLAGIAVIVSRTAQLRLKQERFAPGQAGGTPSRASSMLFSRSR